MGGEVIGLFKKRNIYKVLWRALFRAVGGAGCARLAHVQDIRQVRFLLPLFFPF